jgi:signal transduction histidine kinase/ligand-binding sensor domain-containing protein
VVHGSTEGSFDRTRRGAGRIALAAFVFFWSGSASALDPSLDVSQYTHTAWKTRDRLTQGTIPAIAQTPDGYLWLGTDSGLLRFDGVRAVPWLPPAGEQLPANFISSLLVARDGTLWIGTIKGLASWKNGQLTQYPEFAAHQVYPIRQTRDGTVWFGVWAPGRLCAVQAGKIRCEGDGSFGRAVTALYEDHSGNLWVSGVTGLWRWKPGPAEHFDFPPLTTEANDLIEDDSGRILLAANGGSAKRLEGGKIQSHPLPGIEAVSRPTRFLRSSDGSLWIGTLNGLVHLHAGKGDVFGAADGLSGESVYAIYEDRERNIWVSTSGGLDRFREYTFPSITTNQGLSNSLTWAVQATADGSIWIAAANGLNRWQDGRFTFYGKRTAATQSRRGGTAESRVVPQLETVSRSLGVDDKGRLWTAITDGVFYLEGDRFVRVPGLPGGNVWSFAPDGPGNMWVSHADVGLFHWTGVGAAQQFRWDQFGSQHFGATALLPDRSQGGLWIGFAADGVAYFRNGRIVASYTATEGLGSGAVTDLRLGEQGALWAATESGLSRIENGNVRTLTSRNGLPCEAVHWSIEDADHFSWLYTPCGLVRVARSELDAWASDPRRRIDTTVFDASEGVAIVAAIGSYGPHVTKAPDGKIWFATREGVTRIDPRRLPHNDLPPPLHVEQISADGKVYDASAVGSGRLRLPPRVRDLILDYTALSLVAPEKVRFRVKLEGQDNDWRELINERRVHYTNLPPRDYRFLVKASNNSGVWNEEGASIDFTIPPVFYQTNSFRALCVAVFLGLFWAAYRIRVGVLERRQRLLEQHQMEITALNERLMKAQEEERSRIAGELHDGVVQQMTTVNTLLGVATLQVPPDSRAKATIDKVQDIVIGMGSDVRHLSHELHPGLLTEQGLPDALSFYCKEFSTTRGIPVTCEADSGVKELSPGTALALYRIAQEALGNAAKHSKAKQVRVRLMRADVVVRLTVSDDGIGFVPGRGGDSGGVGLVSMRERARQLNGTLQLESQPGRGTIVRAEVPFRPA